MRKARERSLDGGVRGISGNTAVVVAVAGHPDVTLLAPGDTPGVLDDPVLAAAISVVTDSEDTVVELGGGAVGLIVDSRLVELEGVVGGIDGDRDGADETNSVLEGSLASGGDVGVLGHGGTLVGGAVVAASVLGGVGVRGLSVDTSVLDDVLESAVHLTAVAAEVSVAPRAIEEVLLGEADEGVSLELPGSLEGTGGRERPASSALTLVLDSSDGTSVTPVLSGGGGGIDDLLPGELSSDDDVAGLGGLAVTGVETDELVVGEVSKLVETDLEGTVPVVDKVDVGGEDLEAVLELVVAVGLAVLLHPHEELGLIVLGVVSRGDGDEREDGQGDREDLHVV